VTTVQHSVAFSPLRTRFTFVYVHTRGVPFIVYLSVSAVIGRPCGCRLPFTGVDKNNILYLCMHVCQQRDLPVTLEMASDASVLFYKCRKKTLCLIIMKTFYFHSVLSTPYISTLIMCRYKLLLKIKVSCGVLLCCVVLCCVVM
jgi:hypothetical protein